MRNIRWWIRSKWSRTERNRQLIILRVKSTKGGSIRIGWARGRTTQQDGGGHILKDCPEDIRGMQGSSAKPKEYDLFFDMPRHAEWILFASSHDGASKKKTWNINVISGDFLPLWSLFEPVKKRQGTRYNHILSTILLVFFRTSSLFKHIKTSMYPALRTSLKDLKNAFLGRKICFH